MSHTCLSPVFSSVTRLLAVSESIAEMPHRQVAKWANRLAHSDSSVLFQAYHNNGCSDCNDSNAKK